MLFRCAGSIDMLSSVTALLFGLLLGLLLGVLLFPLTLRWPFDLFLLFARAMIYVSD